PIEMPWSIVDFHGLLPDHLSLHHPKRDVPIYMEHAGTVEVNVRIHYPDSYAVVLVPLDYTSRTDGLSFERTVKAENGTFTFHEKTAFPKVEVASGNWDEWRKILFAADKKSDRMLLFKTEED
ncbi:MAG: hypothetical protein ABIE92_05795, partial [bacterium]